MTPQLLRNVKRQTWLLTYILLPLIRALDWLLCKRHFGLRLLDPERIITRRLDPQRLIKKARAIAGDGPFHLPCRWSRTGCGVRKRRCATRI